MENETNLGFALRWNFRKSKTIARLTTNKKAVLYYKRDRS